MVDWNFLLAILLSKSAVFLTVLLGCMVVTSPSDYSKGALYAIFCTQSNDFALGYPISEWTRKEGGRVWLSNQ